MKKTLVSLIVISFFISGCASFGRGVAEAILKPQTQNKGECRVFSSGFDGIENLFARNNGTIRIIMVHGIGKSVPGYTMGFVENLAIRLKLNKKAKRNKDIILTNTKGDTEDLGHLRVYRFTNEDETRELLFYEYTWASITETIKKSLAFDSNDSNASKRTDLSRIIKKFINDTGTDAVIYLGNDNARKQILTGLSQTFCWMLSDSWVNLPEGNAVCSEENLPDTNDIKDYIIMTHSLGSQISIDTLQDVAVDTGNISHKVGKDKYQQYAQNTNVTVFMFANQLPAIAIGKEHPAITNKEKDYCSPNAPLRNQRFLNNLNIIAFSDPNDVLSYTIPPKFENKYIDSRLCPDITNIIVNVAPLSNLFGTITANPLEAHSNYQKDERIINAIVNGINKQAQEKNKDCLWIETVE